MLKNRIMPALMLLLTSFAQTAHAFLDPPYITPEHPVAGETISVNIYGGICDAIVGAPGYPQITQEGNAIRILLLSVSYSSPELCFWTIGTATVPVGAYPVGSYTLQVDRTYSDGGGNTIVETLGLLPFTVAGVAAPVVPVPAIDWAGICIFVLMVIGAATTSRPSRRDDRTTAPADTNPCATHAAVCRRNVC